MYDAAGGVLLQPQLRFFSVFVGWGSPKAGGPVRSSPRQLSRLLASARPILLHSPGPFGPVPYHWLQMTVAAELSDIELVDLVIAGQAGAFDAFYHRFKNLISASVRRRLSGTFASPNVEDVVYEFFLRLLEDEYRILKGWQRGSSLATYLFVVVRNHASDYIRRHAKAGELRQYVDLEEWFDPGALWSETPAHSLGIQQLRRAVAHACQHIKQPRSRLLLRLKLIKQLPNDEIAERVQMSDGATRTAISRAKSDLIAELKRVAPEYFPESV